ncbi:unnamed protein product [Soboliphyme baturini]|uniref:Uncharacterized protein n=1 Tax=Soboliphyme baturini TaxID=241478 RepID=A0A183I9S8_9BILA|nr:unnamed protein product [Soboliphyme baturini]
MRFESCLHWPEMRPGGCNRFSCNLSDKQFSSSLFRSRDLY